MIEIPALVTSTWTILQPILPIIVNKGAEEIGKSAIREVWDAIKSKFDGEAHTKKVLVKLLKDPKNTDVQAAFRVVLQDFLEEDQSFAEKLSKLLEAAGCDFKGQVIGGGALAQGNGATAIGQNGVYIGGNAGDVNVGKR